ncbi:polyphosphate polymerase domain-containing protein [Demequina muriae]|uniref:Polyphosphate polymerase domain-containing protein n=1 Tax=Demequina muriae TaxID=3051664 RepID=A0ABT8GGU2_9MICO|nr:polyphosphate polymerase domain-containing protein [Demequina sp. EGI L300058]MDN4480656.1 polyphosphate polymerase domain-containing protein [Demequina sp. EGI L300058]
MTATGAWPGVIGRLAPVTLEELDATAALQTRTDRKYVLRPETWALALASLDAAPRVLDIDGLRTFRYESVYYDTPDLDSYRMAARRRPLRYKVRTRQYVDTGTVAVEVKLRSRTGETVKHREWLSPGASRGGGPRLPAEAQRFVASFPATADAVGRLAETLTTSYERVTLLTADARVTVDAHVRGRDNRGREAGFGDLLIVEVKASARAGAVDRALWSLGVRPSRVSKYCTALAALRPDLPSHRWARTLRRHLDAPQPALAGA